MKRWFLPVLFVIASGLTLYRLAAAHPHPSAFDIPFSTYEKQPDGITCGPTSALMVLHAYGVAATLGDVKSRTKTEWFTYGGQPVGMTSPEYVSKALTGLGVPADLRKGDLDELKHHVSQNKPVIALMRSGKTTWHYAVVTGFDEGHVVLADPGPGGQRVMTTADFLGAWDFTHDMYGVPASDPCKMCDGSGKWLDVEFGPLTLCDVCGGSGRAVDPLAAMLFTAEVYPNLMVVPDSPIGGHK